MTALDLGTATRTLTVPGSAFSTVPYGDVNLIPVTAPVTPTTWNGIPALPATESWATDRTLASDAPFAVPQDAAIFVALGGLYAAMSTWNVLWHQSGFDLGVSEDTVNYHAGGNGAYGPNGVTMPTTFGPTDLIVLCIVSNSVEMRLLNNVDGTLNVVASAQAASPSDAFEVYLNGSDAYVLGIWQFDGVVVNETDAIDTMAAIVSELTPASSVGATGAGGWGITGAATGSDDDDEDDPAVTVPNAGGAQTPPARPTFSIPSGMDPRPLRHVWERMPAPTLDANLRPVNWTATAEGDAEIGHIQIVAEGVDVTYLHDTETPIPEWSNAEPFGDQTAVFTFPQITAFHPTPAWSAPGANIAIYLNRTDGGTDATLFDGVVARPSDRSNGGPFTIEATGLLLTADTQLRKPSFTTAPKDIGTLIPNLFNDVVSRRYSAMSKSVTGIRSSVAGGWEQNLTGFVQDILATAVSGGKQWTVMHSGRVPVLAQKDTTTISWEVRYGQRGVEIDLGSDAAEAPNAIYGEGIAPDGGRWRNAKYPNWKPDDTPDYPYDPPTTSIKVGTRDADTDSGDGVSVWQRKVGQPITGTFSRADRLALKRIQRAAGITVDGFLGPQSWATTFDTGANTGSLDGAFIAPLAAATEVESRLYGPDGDDLGANGDYDSDVMRVERYINFGQGVKKATGAKGAAEILARDVNPGWNGTVTFRNIDPEQMSRFELRAGQNGRINGFRGQNLTVHVAHVDVTAEAVTLRVDTQARDYPTLAAIQRRDREATDPAREAVRRLIAGKISTDRATYDAESPAGRMPKHAVYGGLWDVRRIPMGAFGRIVRTDFRTSSSATPFALAVFGKQLTAADLVSLIGNPLTATSNPWSEYGDELEDLGLLQAWGWKEQPAGYYPRTYSDPTGETAAPVTGRLLDDASWDYASAQSPWLWVATIASSSCNVEGRFYGGAD